MYHLGRFDLEEPNTSLPRKNGKVEEATKSKHSKIVQGTSAINKVCMKGQAKRNKVESTMIHSKHKL